MKLKHLLLSTFLLLSAGTAWADVTINETNFPDAIFRYWLKSQEYGKDGVLTQEEIAGVTSIDLFDNRDIQSLKGIEYFTALEKLDCQINQLASLDVSKNTALTELYCAANQLTTLDVSKNTALTRLSCGNNQLTTLDVSKNTALTWLDCTFSQLTSLNVSGCTALTQLNCYRNQLKGESMDALIESLPTVSSGTMRVIYNKNEQNVMTTTQVASAKAKGWTPYYTENGFTWKVYAGVDPATSVNAIDADDVADSAPWYTINGVLLTEKPTQPGIYIHGGKKVVVK